MISVAEATGRILDAMRPTGTETVGLSAGWGRVLAAPVAARLDQPPGDVSAMDGYALRAGDGWPMDRHRQTPPPVIRFGGTVGVNQAVRLFTGSLVPAGADAIAIQEDADRDGDRLTLREAPVAGRHIRTRGGDFEQGEIVLAAGTRLTARAIGLAAAANHPWLTVHRRPRIAILATGDEIALPGDPVRPGGIVSSNAHALAALIALRPVPTRSYCRSQSTTWMPSPPPPTRLPASTCSSPPAGPASASMTSIQKGLATRGFTADFWKIAMRPGKPLIFGQLTGTPVLGLPGNPVSALVCAILFLVPALKRLAGEPEAKLPTLPWAAGRRICQPTTDAPITSARACPCPRPARCSSRRSPGKIPLT